MFTGTAETSALVAELIGRAEYAVLETVNSAAALINGRAALTAPREPQIMHLMREERAQGAPYPAKQLFESGEVIPATPESPVAQVIYDSPYASAQEVGEMVYTSRGGSEVEWMAEFYSTPGTGAHFLEDATKTVLGPMAEQLALQARIAFGGVPGRTPSLGKSELQKMGMAALGRP